MGEGERVTTEMPLISGGGAKTDSRHCARFSIGATVLGSLGCRLSRKNTHQIKSLELLETGTVALLNSRRLLSAYLAPFRYLHYKRPPEGLCFAILRRPRRLREMSLIMLLGPNTPALFPQSVLGLLSAGRLRAHGGKCLSLSTQIASCLPACEHHLAPCGVTYFLFFLVVHTYTYSRPLIVGLYICTLHPNLCN